VEPGVDDQRVIELYLEKGISINEKDNEEQTALFEAIKARRTDLVEFLLSKGADIEAKNKWGETPLAVCAGRNPEYSDVVELLLNKGANMEVKNRSGETLLWAASMGRDPTIAKLLIKHGAKTDIQDKAGNAFKEYLKKNNRLEILELIEQTEATK
jgi:ankyrin repeat protein